MRARWLLLFALGILSLSLGRATTGGAAPQPGPTGSTPTAGFEGARFDLTGMTYVASQAGEARVVLAADRAEVHPERDAVLLEGVQLSVAEQVGVVGFELDCDRGELQLGAGDFLAEGDVRGRTRDGRELRTERLRYEHGKALVRTDAPVVIRDDAGTYSGGGFEYFVREARFRLLGGATLVQEP